MQYDIIEMIAEQIGNRPGETAVSGIQSLSYRDLDRLSAGVAASLAPILQGKTGRVVVLSKDPEVFIPSLLGVLRAGGTYVPVLPDLPPARLDFINRKVGPAAVLHDVRGRAEAEAHFPALPLLDFGSASAAENATGWPKLPPDHPAYVFFTSGSTGEPKGIVGRYASLGQFISWEAGLLGLEGPAKVSQLVSPMFDAFLRDVLLPLSLGGCCCIPDESAREDISLLAAWVGASGVEVVHTVPSMFRTLFGHGSSGFPALRHVLLSGEPLLPSDAALWMRRLGEGVSLHNLYGATETTMTKFFHRVSPQDAGSASIPVGRPMDGAAAWIADENFLPAANGETGEIVVETEFRTLGYLDDPKTTELAFVASPGDPSRILYRTGDMGRMRSDGAFEFQGRKDRQVKIRGVRVELSEIEEAARMLSGVLDCVVDVETQADGTSTLALHSVLSHGLSVEALRIHLRGQLPALYLPSAVRACREIPRLISGKVDFAALRSAAKAPRRESPPPSTPTEEFILALFRDLVRFESADMEENFFDLGGHSLLAIQALSRIREECGVEVPLGTFFENSTARALATYIDCCSPDLGAPEAPPAEEERLDLAAMSDQDLDRLLADLSR